MTRLRIRLLGAFQVSLDDVPLHQFGADTARALLAYLAMRTGEPVSREIIASLLWPESTQPRALHNLRQALTRLRSTLGDQDAEPPFLQVTRETLCFCPQSPYWIDVAAFEEVLAAVRAHSHHSLTACESCARQLEEAAALYRSSFLDGFYIDSIPFEEWLVIERERLHRLAIDVFHKLADYYENNAVYDRARAHALRQLETEPWREEAHQQLMRALSLSEQRSAALAQYEACRRLLADELGVEPAAETTALYEAIKAGTFPPPQAPPRSLHNLPAPGTPFIGRRDETVQLVEKLLDPAYRVLTLTGLGGVGKTRLALTAASQVANRFPDGVWFVPLSEVDTDHGDPSRRRSMQALAIAQALSLPFSAAQDVEARLLEFLRNQELLLILDNLDPWLEEGADLVSRINQSAPGVTVLITSRERVNLQAEHVTLLSGLAVPTAADDWDAWTYSSVQLFCERADRTTRGFVLDRHNLPYVIQICRFVEGLPLGIELAAALVEDLPVDQIAAAIQRDLDNLATTMRDVPMRHRSIRAVFESSWQLLPAREQSILAQFSIFRGGFDLDAAQAIAGAEMADVQALIDKSLLYVSETKRYTTHGLVRQLAAEKLQGDCGFERASGEAVSYATSCLQHAKYYLALLAARTPALRGRRPQAAIAEIQRDWDNIHQAWHWAVADHRLDLLAQATDGLQRFLLLKGLTQWGKLMFSLAIEATRTLGGADVPVLRTRLLLGVARFLLEEGHCAQAAAVAKTAIGLAQEHYLKDLEPATYLEWGSALRGLGQYAEALSALERALRRAKAIQDQGVVVRALNMLGNITGQLGDSDQANMYLEEALRLSHDLDDVQQEAGLLNSLGCVATDQGLLTRAIAYLEEAQRSVREMGMQGQESLVLHSLGVARHTLGDYAAARTYYEQSLRIARDVGLRRGEVEVLASLSLLLHHQGEDHVAAAIGQQAIDLARSLGDRAIEARALLHRGHALAAQHSLDEAAHAYEQALALQRELGQRNASLEPIAGLANVALVQEDGERALARVEEILPYLETGIFTGMEEPARVYWTCYQVLRARDDHRAGYIRGAVRVLLRSRAERIHDEDLRRAFLENVAVHRAVLAVEPQAGG